MQSRLLWFVHAARQHNVRRAFLKRGFGLATRCLLGKKCLNAAVSWCGRCYSKALVSQQDTRLLCSSYVRGLNVMQCSACAA
jgi:hypothetical protein